MLKNILVKEKLWLITILTFSFLYSCMNSADRQDSKQVRDIENKLSNVREMLLHHDETFGEILESLSLNQLAVSALKEYLTSES